MSNFTFGHNVFKSRLLYQKIIFISWYQKFHLLISEIPFIDIRNSIYWYQKFILWCQEIHFLISNNLFSNIKKYWRFSDIKKYIFWYQIFIFWYQEFEFLISENHLTRKNRAYFLIFFDIRKSISWYQKIMNIYMITW